jgi:anti-anti-sigma factor
METKVKNTGAYITSEFFLSKRVNKFKTIFDARSNNTIVMLDFDRGTVYEAAEFYEYVNNLIEKDNVRIIIDLENIYFIDSVFFGSLIKLLKQADKKFGYIKLIVDHKSKPELLSISNFEGIFEIYPNLFEAINHNKAV